MADTSQPKRSPARQSGNIASGRPQDLASLPVFLTLRGKRAVLAGGNQAAAWKAELLAATGASLTIYAPQFEQRLRELADDKDNVTLVQRSWQRDDLAGAAIFIGDACDEDEAAEMQAAARAAGVPVNVIDKPKWSDFNFGSIVDRSPLLIAISTSGAAPVFAQAIRTRIEALLPEGLRRWAQAALEWRPAVKSLDLPADKRRSLWTSFARRALAEPAKIPDQALSIEWLAEAAEHSASTTTGSVILAGAGPGDAELLTLRAVRALQNADVVMYDDLVSASVLDLARREAEKVSVGKRGYKPSCTQEDICQLMIEYARAGKNVVRLKGGDPMIFGRAGEEITALGEAGIAVEVIPGVTAASAAAARLGTSLTERVLSRRVQFVTAHARGGQMPDDLNWPALADPRATTIAYMGVHTLDLFSEKLIAAGMPAHTPAVIAQHVTWESEAFLHGTIGTLPALAAGQEIASPALIIIGEIVGRKKS